MDEAEKIVEGLHAKDYARSGPAAEMLYKRGDARPVEPLWKGLTDRLPGARRAAAEALGNVGGMRAFEPLSRALMDTDAGVREAAAEALGKICDVSAVEPLSRASTDRNSSVRNAAIRALGAIGDIRAVEVVSKALSDTDTEVRASSASVLGSLRRREALPDLRDRFRPFVGEHDETVREYLRRAIDSIERATAGTAALPRAAEPEAPDAAKRPRAAEDGENP